MKIPGHVCGLGKVQHADFAMASGEMSRAEFTQFLTDAIAAMAAHLRDGAIVAMCMDWRHLLLPVDAPWLAAFRSELKAFPSGRYDDQADSFSQFVNYQLRHWKWVMTEYGRGGRARKLIRCQKRPW